jgi:hypothetical protein
MSTRPQTLYGLADSPIDLAAFMLDHGDGTGQPGLVKKALQGTLDSALTLPPPTERYESGPLHILLCTEPHSRHTCGPPIR